MTEIFFDLYYGVVKPEERFCPVVRKRRPKPVNRRKESQEEEKSKYEWDDPEPNATNTIDRDSLVKLGVEQEQALN